MTTGKGQRPVLQFVAQCLSPDELGHQVELALDLFQRIDRGDTWMRQHRGRARLRAEAVRGVRDRLPTRPAMP